MKKYDLIVVGGGIAGICAAVAAARQELSVLLIEESGTLGGAMTNGLVYPFMRHMTRGEKGKVTSAGLFEEIKKRHSAYGEASWETYRIIFDEMMEEAGVTVLFHATVMDAIYQDRTICGVKAATKSGVLEFFADFFIDASGDGSLIAMTGCDYQLGREGDSYCQPMTTCFRLCNVDVDLFLEEEAFLQEKYLEYKEKGLIHNPRENLLIFKGIGEGVLHFNTTRIVKEDPTDAFGISRAEMGARKQIKEMFDFMKENAKSCKNATLVYVANHIGIRESRKLKGVHILSEKELIECKDFEDTIALGCYDIDIHNPTGTGTYIYKFGDGEYYKIPYRSLLPKEYDNMLVAGRCLSADHAAHSSVRIIPICANMGEAAGVAAAVCKKDGANAHTVDVQKVRSILLDGGAVLR